MIKSALRSPSLLSWGLLFLAVQIFWAVTAPAVLAQDTSKSPIVIMGDRDYPPYESLVDGKPSGINVDLWQELAKILGRPLELRLYQWADSQARVRRGEAKVLTFMSFNSEREKFYDFSKPTFTAKFPIFVLAQIVDQFDVSDLTGKRIAVKKGGFPRTLIETIHPEAEIVFVDSALEGFSKLLRGEVDGVMEDERVGNTIIRKNSLYGVRATSTMLAVKTGHIAVVKGNPALLRQIDEALEELKANGKFDKIVNKWESLGVVHIDKETIKFIVVSVLVAIVLIFGIGGVVYVLRMRKINLALRKEITDRKQAQMELRKSTALFRAVVNHSPTKIHIKDVEGRYTLINKLAEKLFGVTDEESRGKTTHDLFEKEKADVFVAHDQEVIDSGVPMEKEEEFTLEDGVHTFLTTKFPIFDKNGITGIGAIGTDITKRKKTEKALKESEERLRKSVLNAPIPIVLHAEDGEILMLSNKWVELSGYSHSDIPTIKDWTEKAYGIYKKHMKSQRKAIKALYDLKEPSQHVTYITTASGEQRTWDVHNAPLGRLSDGRRFVISMAVDVTERNVLQKQLLQSQKMETVGQLTGGVAHDFNNLMGVIMGNLEMAKDDKSDEERNELISNAIRAVDRGAALTQQLLSFSRLQALSPKVVLTNDLVSDTLRLIERTLGEYIEIEQRLSDEAPPIKIDTALFGTALLNLSLNARDAMPGGGKLTITTTRVELDGEIMGEDKEPITGPYALITVSDMGCGIHKDDLDRVIEPFFTTKEVGEGSGLGLSMVYGFIEQSGGYMTIDSKQGKGTTVSLYIPVTDGKADEDTALDASYEPEIQSKTILVVEDDPDVLKTTSRILTDLGYRVLEAADAPSAEEMLSGKSDEIDLVFADMVMPKGMNGVELAEWAKGKYDHIKVLLTSGYPDKVADTDYIKSSGVSLLAKPYRRVQLAKAIDNALSSE